MPNHIHGIVIIEKERAQASSAPTIGQIIQLFKSKSAMEYLIYVKDNNLDLPGKIWQRNYNEHIIRDENELEQIRTYIVNNPIKWNEDHENPENIEINNQRAADIRSALALGAYNSKQYQI